MKALPLIARCLGFLVFGISAYTQTAVTISELKADGASGFPQRMARVLIDDENLKVSIINDSNYLAVQTILWKDNDAGSAIDSPGQEWGDYSSLLISTENGNKRAPNLDRSYTVNPRPRLVGLYYSVYSGRKKFNQKLPDGRTITFEAEAQSPLKSDTKGRGRVEYLAVEGGRKIRVDTMLIPLSELNTKGNENLRVCYIISSPNPRLTFNSCGYHSEKDYFSLDIPYKNYQTFVLSTASGNELDKTIPIK